MQYFDITVPVNKPFTVSAQGSFLYYLAGSAGGADSTIKVRCGYGTGAILLKPGQSIRLPKPEAKSDAWIIENYGGAATIVGSVLVGEGDFSDNRISGAVEVIDGGKNRTTAGSAFMGYGVKAGTAGQFIRVQLWNPPGSNIRLNVESVLCGAGAGATFAYGQFSGAALGTLIQQGVSKKSGGAPSVAQINVDSTAVSAVWPGTLFAVSIPANSSVSQKLVEPVVLSPGSGLVMWATTGNVDLGASFEWFEEANV